MTVNYTTNLALGQPVTGTESGTWGDDVNNAVTSYLDIAIAGGLAVTITTADVTLTLTQGTSSATNIGSTTAQYAILNVSGAMTAARSLIVPSSSRIYLINNNTTGGFALTVKGSATSGVTLVNGEKAHVFWNGSDYAKLSNAPGGAGTFSSITNTGLTSGRVVYSTTGGLETDSANLLYSGTDLTVYGITVGRGAGAVASNTALGYQALLNNTTGSANVFIGYNAGLNLVTGTNNIGIGQGTLNGAAGSSQYNVAVGWAAMNSNVSGGSNIGLGYQALYSNTTASNNTAVGYQAGYTNTTGSVTALGWKALFANTTGTENTAVGSGSLLAATTAIKNTAIGYLSGYQITTGSQNTGTGRQSMQAVTTGASNDAHGHNTLFSTTTGNYNVAMGDSALFSNTTASANTAVGFQALYTNTTSANSTAVGYQALLSSTGGGNTAVGQAAGDAITTGSNNTFIGYVAGSNATTGTYNTFVGIGSGLSMTTGGKNTILGSYDGNQGGLDIRTASNYIVLSDGDGNPRGIFDGSGNLLVGTTTSRTSKIVVEADGTTTYGVTSNMTAASGTRYHIIFRESGTERGSITSNGTATVYNTTSDYRLKTVIGAVSGSGQRIDALQPVEYTWNSNGQRTRGFLAHQFQEVYADSVTGTKDAVDADGNPVYQAMQAGTSEVIADLIAEIQSLRKRLTALEST